MARIVRRSVIPNNRPAWLEELEYQVNLSICRVGELSTDALIECVDWNIHKLKQAGVIKSDVAANKVSDEGVTAIMIKRNGKLLTSYIMK